MSERIHLHHDGLSRPLENPRLRVLSLGAGVQSTTLALMSARGELEPLDCAIFADTQSEPVAVYRHLAWLETQLPFPVHHVTAGSLRANIVGASRWSDGRFVSVPFFTSGGGLVRRQCTKEFKLEPIEQEIRRLLGLAPRQRGPKARVVELWIGISTDEKQRMKDPTKRYVHNRWPLIEARMNRVACEKWLRERQYPRAPKSACTFCPFTDNERWVALRDGAPDDFADAVAVDETIRHRGTMRGMDEAQFVHRTLVPLAEAQLDEPDDPRFGFANECEGMCGV